MYLTEAVDEYCISAIPEFDGKKFQNVAKEGLEMHKSSSAKEKFETLTKKFEPLTKWLEETALKGKVNMGFTTFEQYNFNFKILTLNNLVMVSLN